MKLLTILSKAGKVNKTVYFGNSFPIVFTSSGNGERSQSIKLPSQANAMQERNERLQNSVLPCVKRINAVWEHPIFLANLS